MQAFTHTEFIKKLLEDDPALAAKKQSIVFPFLKSDMHLYKYSDNSANAYIKLETISSRLKRLFGDNFVISSISIISIHPKELLEYTMYCTYRDILLQNIVFVQNSVENCLMI